jgi:glycosyltransferase involved in cell wall biosynthesis
MLRVFVDLRVMTRQAGRASVEHQGSRISNRLGGLARTRRHRTTNVHGGIAPDCSYKGAHHVDKSMTHGSGAAGVRPLLAMVAACPFPCRRGTPVRIQRMAQALAERGAEVHVVTYHYGEEALADPPYRVHRTARLPGGRRLSPGPSPAKLLVFDPLLFARLLGVVRRFGIGVIHAHHYEGLAVALAVRRLTGAAVVYDAHTLLHAELPYYGPGPLRPVLHRLGRWLDHKLPAMADHVVATTDEIRDFLCTRAVEASDVSVIGNGIEDVADDIAAAEAASPKQGSERIVFAGNLAAYQGVDLLLRAFARVATARPGAELVLVTSSSFAPFDPLVAGLGIGGRVRLVDARDAPLWPELLAAGALANPRVESPGYPLKLLNYMAAGRPIVSFAGSAKGLTHGVDAWVVADGDVDAFADGLHMMLEGPALAHELGSNARRRVFEEFAWAVVADQLEAVYARLSPPATTGGRSSLGRRRWPAPATALDRPPPKSQ